MTASATPPIPAPPGRVRPPWPPWYGFAALGLAVVGALVASGILFVFVEAAGAEVKADSPGLLLAGSFVQDLLFVAAALWLAARIAPPKPWHFGIDATTFRRGLKWAAIPFGCYFVFQIAYSLAVRPEEQTTLKDLGAGTSTSATIIIGLLVVGLAPWAEEFFFRGFFYGALRTRLSFVAAALVDGVVFGVLHAGTGVQAVPPLIALGIALCVTYEATGSILPGVILHALNNTLAFGVDKDGSWLAGGVIVVLVITSCVVVAGRTQPARAAPG